MTPRLKLVAMSLIGGLGFVIWSAMAYFDPAMRGDYSKFVITITGGVICLALREMQPAPPQSQPSAPVQAAPLPPLPPLPPAP